MAKAEWGHKRTCFSCGARFYDLRRDPIVCPICSAVYDPDRQPRVRRGGSAVRDDAGGTAVADKVAARGLAPALLEDEVEDVDLEELDESAESESDDLNNEDAELMEDTSDLGEDDDDIGEVMEHVDDELEDKA